MGCADGSSESLIGGNIRGDGKGITGIDGGERAVGRFTGVTEVTKREALSWSPDGTGGAKRVDVEDVGLWAVCGVTMNVGLKGGMRWNGVSTGGVECRVNVVWNGLA